eukprot:9721600-Lingulodinium_polyedra.AAC.1
MRAPPWPRKSSDASATRPSSTSLGCPMSALASPPTTNGLGGGGWALSLSNTSSCASSGW